MYVNYLLCEIQGYWAAYAAKKSLNLINFEAIPYKEIVKKNTAQNTTGHYALINKGQQLSTWISFDCIIIRPTNSIQPNLTKVKLNTKMTLHTTNTTTTTTHHHHQPSTKLNNNNNNFNGLWHNWY